MCPCIPDRIGILAVLVFEERGKLEYPEKNLSEQGENQQHTQPTHDAGTGNRTRPHCGEASALTTAPPLLPYVSFVLFSLAHAHMHACQTKTIYYL